VIESDVGYPINVFGTVIARDQVDYKCVYLFRRERDDSQCIESPVCFCPSLEPSWFLLKYYQHCRPNLNDTFSVNPSWTKDVHINLYMEISD
jgi:hypothetical protein